jgi:hypothetical protein
MMQWSLERFDMRPERPELRSSFTQPKLQPREQGARESFWREGASTKQHWDSGRTAGYIAGYVKFAGPVFPATGIPVQEGFVWLDKGVICSLREGSCIEFADASFRLTEKGRALIAPFVRLSDAQFGVAV